MARPTTKKPSDASPDTGAKTATKARSARTLLMAAALLSVGSLGGGFVLARMAFQQDAASYEPEYLPESEATAEAGTEGAEPEHAAAEPEATAGHGGNGEGKLEGLLPFEEIVTNINSFDARGNPTKAFLKLNLVLVYRPEAGAADLMASRQPFMRDLFTGYARSLTETDVRGMAGVLTVKAELLKRARAAAGNDLPQEILISDLIVQ
ncbi:flagellar basal body-associated FliL family protein [Pseudodonghicola flavimaris]|uniref:Flagellar protein FliL n=1 Tax=Pseudodonghicola flavimaris TaxID=3050036 RepID=A0ABT7EWI4_9RHOB|nr:flagellar basal body-associated FliL family protein [Pseudodonghicola flavimaris]MDK3016702.1 flagellar basal body-associated FliL family protein [Pseudodonghicola flavimaris]